MMSKPTHKPVPYAGREPVHGEPQTYCYACGGDGFVEDGPCPACAGRGRIPKRGIKPIEQPPQTEENER